MLIQFNGIKQLFYYKTLSFLENNTNTIVESKIKYSRSYKMSKLTFLIIFSVLAYQTTAQQFCEKYYFSYPLTVSTNNNYSD